jgi:type IV pilus assembly protein PilV
MMMIEVLIAMLIFSIGVLGMVMLQAVSTANSVNSEDRATAALLASDVISQLWTSGKPPVISADALTKWQSKVSGALPIVPPTPAPSVTIAGSVATVVIQWNPRKGRSTDLATSTYSTQVVIE